MLNKDYQKNIEIFLSLPDKIKELFWDERIVSGVESIFAVNNIPEEKKGIIVDLISDVLMGYLSYKDFSQELLKKLSLEPLVNKIVAEEIDKLVFLPVRDSLKQIYNPEGIKEEKRVEKQGTAGLLQKLGQPLDVTRGKPLDVAQGKPLESIQEKSFGSTQDKEFTVSPAKPFGATPLVDATQSKPFGTTQDKQSVNVIDLSQGPALARVEIKPFGATQEKPFDNAQSKPTFPLFKFGNFDSTKPAVNTEIKSGMIFGKEQTVKPILETTKPMDFSFGEVKPQKEKIVSDVEIQGGFGMPIKKPEIAKPIEKPSFFGKLNNIVAPKNINTQPIKVVNFASSVPPPPAIPKEEKPVDFGIKTPFISVNSPLSKNINNIPSPQINTPISVINSVEKPIIPNLNQELPKPKIKEETMPSVPPENIVNLKKLKF